VSNYCNDKTAAFYENMLVTVKIRYISKSVRLQGKGNLISFTLFLIEILCNMPLHYMHTPVPLLDLTVNHKRKSAIMST